MKRMRYIAVGLAVLLTLSLAACGGGGAAPSGGGGAAAPAGGSGSPPAPEFKSYDLIVNAHSTSISTQTATLRTYLDEITRRSDGRLQFELHTDATLASARDVVDAINGGLIDIALVNVSQQSGRFPLSEVVSLPGSAGGLLSYEIHAAVNNLYFGNETTKAMLEKEWLATGVRPIGLSMSDGSRLFSNKPLNKLEDVKGLRVICSNPNLGAVLVNLGASIVGLNNNEAYEALARGTVDATIVGISAAVGLGHHEATHWIYNIGLQSGGMMYGINEKLWQGFDQELRDIFMDVALNWQPTNAFRVYVEEVTFPEDQRAITKVINTHEFVEMTPEEAEIVQQNCIDVWDNWVKTAVAGGWPEDQALMFLETFRQIAQEAKGNVELVF